MYINPSGIAYIYVGIVLLLGQHYLCVFTKMKVTGDEEEELIHGYYCMICVAVNMHSRLETH